VTAQLLNRQTLRVVESRSVATAAGHKCSVHHTPSAEHKCSAYTPFALHVLLHFLPSTCCDSVSNTTNSSKTTTLRLTPTAILGKLLGEQQKRQCNSRDKTRDTQKPFQKFTERTVTSDNVHKIQKKINKLGNVNYVYKSTGI
jgi:hypothetical protein